MNSELLSGRLRVLNQLANNNLFSLDIGSKNVRFGDVNIDIDRDCRPDVVADARWLPFRNGIFQQVYFSDVVEHLPRGHESKSLNDINRVLRDFGDLILSTPNRILLYLYLDPAWYIMQHRFYEISEIIFMLKTNGFDNIHSFITGGFWTCVNVLWYCLITYPMRRISGFTSSFCPKILKTLEDREYNKCSNIGYTIFIKARKLKNNSIKIIL